MQKSGESAYFGWKGKTLHQITSSLKKNKINITDSHNIFLSNPVVHYRKEIASVDLSYGNPRLNVHIDELHGAGQTIIQTDAPTSCNGIDNTLDINLSTNKYDTGGSTQLTPTLCFSQEDTARRRVRTGGMPKKDIAIVDNAQASRKSQYYTSSSQYLYDRNKAFSQNERPYDKTMYTPSDIACDAPTIKPNNSRFFEQGAAQSGELIMRKKYEAITENLAKYQSAFGCSVANAIAYASKDAGYMPKEKRGYPLTESPRFCFFEKDNTYDFGAPEITSIEMGTGAAIVYFSHSTTSTYSLLYMVISEPDGIIEYGTSSPIFITGLSNQTTYTFTVAVLAIIYTSDVETGSTTGELLYTRTQQNNYTVGKNGNAQNNTAIIYIPSVYNNLNVNEIVDHGFENCLALRLIDMPSSLSTIGDYAFAGCSLLQTITIPSSTINIGYYAFRGCNSLSSIVVESGNTRFSTDGQSLFTMSTDKLLQYCTVGQTNYIVPSSVKIIDIRAFSGSQIQTIIIPDGVNEINEYAFSECTGIETIHIPFSTSVLETGVFSECNELVSITIDSMTIQTFSDNLFYRCYNLETIIIPNSVRHIGSYAFFECTSMNRIIIPNVLEIGDYAFSGCSSLNTFIFNGDRPSIAEHSFENIQPFTSMYYYPSTIGWPGTPISGITPISLVSIIGNTIVGDTLTATHKLVEAGLIDGSSPIIYTWYLGNTRLYNETSSTLLLQPSYESSQIRVAISYTMNGEYTTTISAYTSRVLIIPGPTNIMYLENGDNSISVYFETAINATDYGITVYKDIQDNEMIDKIVYGQSSPIIVSDLTVDTTYSFTVKSMRTTQYDTTNSIESVISDSIIVYSSSGYTNNGTMVTFTGSQSHLFIPNTYTTIPDAFAFRPFSSVTHIIIQNGVDTINSSAFNRYSNLQNIILPNTLTGIGNNAFYNCSNLTSINIPSSVLSITDNIFRNCSNLATITVESANVNYSSSSNVLFNKVQTEIITYAPGKSDVSYFIPSTITKIGAYAFTGCNNLINLMVSNNVKTLGEGGFSSCSSLSTIQLPNSITSIGNSCFNMCTGLQSIILSSNLTQIPSTMFSSCTSLASIAIPSLVTSIDYGAFVNCSNLSSITFYGNKPTIQTDSFYGLSSTAIFYYYSNTTGWEGTTTIDGDGYSYPLVDLYVPTGYSSDGLIYDENNTRKVVGFNGTQTKLWIPASVSSISIYNTNSTVTNIMIGSGVTNIYAFSSFTALEEVIINGNSLTTIDSYAFSNCTSLTYINLPISLTTISNAAFFNCTRLASINLPTSLTNIGINIFQGCTSLTSVTVYESNANFKTIGNALCSYDGSILYSYYDYVSTSCTIPDSVTTIYESAFTSNTTIQSITMNNVITIGNTVFQNCTNLSSITLSNTLTTISSRALQNIAITSIIIPASVTSIEQYAISYCGNLTSITFEGNYPTIDSTAFAENASSAIIYYYSNTTGWDYMTTIDGLGYSYPLVVLNVNEYISNGLIYDNLDSTAVIGFEGIQSKLLIPDEVTSIRIYDANSTVTHIMIGSGVTNIYMLGSFTILEEIIINGNTLTTIDSSAFNNLTSLTAINLPISLTTIGSYAFDNCNSLLSITLPSSLTTIDSNAFNNCTSLTYINLPSSLTTISYGAFNNCTSLASINLPSSLSSIGANIFQGCTSLTTVTVDESNTYFKTIGNALCSYDGSILYSYYDYVSTSYTIPDSVTTINESVFDSNTIIESITMNNVITIGNTVFQNCTNLSSITLSNTLTTISSRALQNLAITSIIIPAMVTSIGQYAISLCSNLTSITFEGNYPTIDSTAFAENASSAIIYYYSGSSGWDGMTTLDGFGYSYQLLELYSDYSSDGLIYEDNNTYTVSYFNGTQAKIIIPNSVTSLGSLAFVNNSTITEVIMFDNVNLIGNQCFSQCTNLINVKLSNTITYITNSLFYNTSIKHIIIPASVDYIVNLAFYNCRNIKTILFEGNKPTIQSYNAFLNTNSDMVIYYYADKTGWDNATQLFDYYTATALYDVGYSSEGLVYDDNDNSIVTGFTGTQTKVLIPDNITKINDWVFQSSKITHVKIGNQVTSIGIGAFAWTSLLQEVTIEGQSLTSIGDYAFWDSALITIKIPSSVSSIGYAIFNLCNNIVRLTIDDANIHFKTEDKTLLSYDRSTIYTYYDNLLSYTIPDSVTTILQEAFGSITLLQSINLNNVSVIGDYAFYYSTSLTSIILGPTVSTIGVQAFYNCTNLTSINLPSSLTSIGTNIFQGCTGLTSVTIDAENTSFITIGNALFSYDGSILYSYYDYVSTSYTIPDSVTTINEYAFASNTAIQSITMNNVVTIGNAVFQDCTNLSSITLSNTLTTISSRALQNLAITSIIIPASVTSIGEYAISSCSNLTSIIFEGDRPTIESTGVYENASDAIIYYYSGKSGWPGSAINGITPTLYSNRDVFTPFTFKTIINNTFSHEIDISNATMTHLKRYLIAPYSSPANYLTITDNYDLSFVEYTNMITYKDYLKTTFQTIADLSGTTAFSATNFRLDSNFHNVYSIDCDSSLNLVFKNNWGKDRTTTNGYISFEYRNNCLQAKSRYKYDASGTNQHTIDASFTGINFYVKYNTSNLSLVSSINNATQFILYSSPFEESLPDDFNPNVINYVTNTRVSINDYIDVIESNLYSRVTNSMTKTAYSNQVASVGPDSSTKSAAEIMLATIKSTVEAQGNSLRYDTSIYSTFRDGALSFQLQSNSAGNGTVGMYTVPYIYFTCEPDTTGTYGTVGKYHPFMCVVSYGISDRPCGLMDIPKPPGDGSTSNYTTSSVTRDQTMGYSLFKIPLLDYGTVNDVTENTVISSDNLRDQSGYSEMPPYNVYNYSMLREVGIMIDGVVIFPNMNNALNSAQYQAELSPKGHHVGRNLSAGLHYHADGHGADANNIFNLYNNLDYVGRSHPPLIGFSFDGIALYGKYENDYSTMSGYSIALDEYGGHHHGDYGYHYHAHDETVNETYGGSSTTLYDYSVMYQNNPNTLSYTGHVLLKGAYKGNVDEIPYFLESGLNQSTVFVGKNTT